MKILRRILLFILIIALIVISVGFLLPGHIHVERKILISASPESVFNQINTLKNWEKWSPWLQSDPSMQLVFSGPESGSGATYKWISSDKNIGKGSLAIISSEPPDSLTVIIDYGENGKSTGKFLLAKTDQGTNVIWNFDSDLGINPLSRWFGLLSDRMIGPDLERGLLNLDHHMTDIKTVTGYEILDYEAPARILITVRDTATTGTLPSKLAEMFKRISIFLKSRDLPPTGSPFAVFHSYTNRNFDIEAGIPVAAVMNVPEGLSCTEKDTQKTIMLKYYGPYKLINGAYNALQTYIDNNMLKISGPGWEEYVTNPFQESDSTKWQTNIYYPIN